ncbi:MAG TPA: flavodoxin family protein, partial [Ramlibacter sp.]|nr:flavodoxin family protein [Ramlibacter sp.]
HAELIAISHEGELPAAGWEQLKAADAIIFGSPTYMGNVSWQFKKFADASSKPWYSQDWKDKLAAGFTSSSGMNGDKLATLTAMFTLAMQHSMIWVSQGLMPANTLDAKRDDLNYLVSYSGAIAQSPADGGTGDMAPGDLATARAFGKRVADVAARFQR